MQDSIWNVVYYETLLGASTNVALRHQVDAVQRTLTQLAEHLPAAQLLLTVPGIGVLTATALVAFVGDIRRFRTGRHFAAYLGLTPREYSTGHVRRHGHNVAAVTLANKLARVAWRVWRDQRPFESRPASWGVQHAAAPLRRDDTDGTPVRPAWSRADNSLGLLRAVHIRLAPHARLSIVARARMLTTLGRRYDCSRPLPSHNDPCGLPGRSPDRRVKRR